MVCFASYLFSSNSIKLCPLGWKERFNSITHCNERFNLTAEENSFLFSISNEKGSNSIWIPTNVKHVGGSIENEQSKNSIKAPEE